MRAIARAAPNIALVKYWGKRDPARNLPAVGSISMTLSGWYTEMAVEPEPHLGSDRLTVNGREEERMLQRVSRCLDDVLGGARPRCRVDSRSNFPIGAGLASSAAAFAALVVAADAIKGGTRDAGKLAATAGRASGSAARSMHGGFVELVNGSDTIEVRILRDASEWPLRLVAAITEEGTKPVGSGEAMERCRASSPFYSRWVDLQAADLDEARAAIRARDFGRLATVAEHNCLKMHSMMWSARPPVVYWNAATVSCLETVRQLGREGHAVFFTMDAGPQVKAVCLPESEDVVRRALADTAGVLGVLSSGVGEGARRVDDR